jgi:hypothetical protein
MCPPYLTPQYISLPPALATERIAHLSTAGQSEREEDEAAGKLADLDRDLMRLLAEHRVVVLRRRIAVCRAVLNEKIPDLAGEP